MRHGSLFSGIGGFDLAAEWMGWENVFNCDIDPFCRKVLKYHFPNAVQYEDIKDTDFSLYRGIDIITGGFPCQPFSAAGKRKGTEDDRHLWPEMLRVIREVQPRWVVGENVHGIVNWSGGLVFEQVQTDLENEGYEVQAYVLPAASVNAPHRRDRVWFVGHRKGASSVPTGIGFCGDGTGEQLQSASHRTWDWVDREDASHRRDRVWFVAHRNSNGFNGGNGKYEKHTDQGGFKTFNELEHGITTNGKPGGLQRREKCGELAEGGRQTQGKRSEQTKNVEGYDIRKINYWRDFPTQSPVCGGDDGLPDRLVGITFPKWRIESIKAMGNAIVPQVALQIFKAIQEYDNLRS